MTESGSNTAEWLVAAGTIALAAATVILAAVAAFQDKIRSWLLRPTLRVYLDNAPPDCHKVPLTARDATGTVMLVADCYYFRLRVKNSGNQRAEQVEVFAKELLKKRPDGTFQTVPSFLPMNLAWSHVHTQFLEAISPSMEKHCDLGHVVDPSRRSNFATEDDANLPRGRAAFSLDLVFKPNTLSHLLPPGDYHLRLLVAAGNARPVATTIEINLTGDWHDDESKMLNEGIGVRPL